MEKQQKPPPPVSTGYRETQTAVPSLSIRAYCSGGQFCRAAVLLFWSHSRILLAPLPFTHTALGAVEEVPFFITPPNCGYTAALTKVQLTRRTSGDLHGHFLLQDDSGFRRKERERERENTRLLTRLRILIICKKNGFHATFQRTRMSEFSNLNGTSLKE